MVKGSVSKRQTVQCRDALAAVVSTGISGQRVKGVLRGLGEQRGIEELTEWRAKQASLNTQDLTQSILLAAV